MRGKRTRRKKDRRVRRCIPRLKTENCSEMAENESLFLFSFPIFLFFRMNFGSRPNGDQTCSAWFVLVWWRRPSAVTTKLTTALAVCWITARRVQIKCDSHGAEWYTYSPVPAGYAPTLHPPARRNTGTLKRQGEEGGGGGGGLGAVGS